jgi:hypothetical protein
MSDLRPSRTPTAHHTQPLDPRVLSPKKAITACVRSSLKRLLTPDVPLVLARLNENPPPSAPPPPVPNHQPALISHTH